MKEMDDEILCAEIKNLIKIMATLRGEEGCPWDRKQDLDSLRQYVLEEAYEVVEAIDSDDMSMLKEELGDLLLQVVFQARIAREEGEFTLAELIRKLNEKLIRRHPHVFAGEEAASAAAVRKTWQRIKEEEKKENEGKEKVPSLLDDHSRSQSALYQAREVQERAAGAGFDWPELEPVLEKVEEEIAELREAIADDQSRDRAESELGDVIFALINLSRFLSIDPELALLGTINRFKERFQFIEKRAEEHPEDIEEISLSELDSWWEEAKEDRKGE